MSTIRNKVQLIGNVGNTPEITNLDTSKKVARLSLATNDYYRNQKGESVQDTQWHNLVAWNKNAGLIENYVPKGKEIAIEGTHQNAAQHKNLQTPPVDILTHRRRGDFIVANRPDHTTPRGVVSAVEQNEDHRNDHRRKRKVDRPREGEPQLGRPRCGPWKW